MTGSVWRWVGAGALAVLVAGCSDKTKEDVTKERLEQMAGGSMAEVVPVRGTIFVDGTPTENVIVSLFQEGKGQPFQSTQTDKDGKYCWSTYQACDGIIPGTFAVTFKYIPNQKKNDSGEDAFRGKYANPLNSKFKLTVEAGKPLTTENYELVTK